MTDTIAPQSSTTAPSRGVLARTISVIFSPRATYADVAARPRALGVLLAITAVSTLAFFAFLSTDVGRNALIDGQLSRMESLGRPMTEAQIARFERAAPYLKYVFSATVLVSVPLLTLAVAAMAVAIFNAALGGNASFTQVFAVAAYASVILALRTIFVLPLNYATASVTSSTTLAVFFPMIADTSFAARLLGQLDLFRMWWIVSLAIGYGVLYKRKTAPIAWSLLGLYAIIAVVIAAAMAAFSGA